MAGKCMRNYFYDLYYQYIDLKNENHSFMIGYFSSLNKVRSAIEKIKEKPGFNESNGVFDVNKFCVYSDKKINKKTEVKIYELSHEYLDSDGYDNYIIFGVYATYEEAEKVLLEKLKLHPYIEYPDGFLIADCKVDVCGWTEGFSSY